MALTIATGALTRTRGGRGGEGGREGKRREEMGDGGVLLA